MALSGLEGHRGGQHRGHAAAAVQPRPEAPQRRRQGGALLPESRDRARSARHPQRTPPAHPAHSGDGHRQDVHLVADHLEALVGILALGAQAADSLSGRPRHPGGSADRPGVPACIRRSRLEDTGRGEDGAGDLLRPLPDACRQRRSTGRLPRLSARLLRLDRRRRVPSGQRPRRIRLARDPRTLLPRRADRDDCHAEARGEHRHVQLLRRSRLHVLPASRHRRRFLAPYRVRRVCSARTRRAGGRRPGRSTDSAARSREGL